MSQDIKFVPFFYIPFLLSGVVTRKQDHCLASIGPRFDPERVEDYFFYFSLGFLGNSVPFLYPLEGKLGKPKPTWEIDVTYEDLIDHK